MRILNCDALATVTVALISLLSSGVACADSLQFGVVGSPIDLSANVHEAILPGGTVFQASSPLFGTEPDPKESAELLHISSTGVNPSPRSNINSAWSRTAMAAWASAS